jgi:ABC-type lipoprotein release transport system permease subunit
MWRCPLRLRQIHLVRFALVVLLAAVGIYGVLRYHVRPRTHKIGILMAMSVHRVTSLPYE